MVAIYAYVKPTNGSLLEQQIAAAGIVGGNVSVAGDGSTLVHFVDELTAPVQQQLDSVVASHNAAQRTTEQQTELNSRTARASAKTAIVTTLQGAVGKAPVDWTNNEFRALVAALAWDRGALNADTTLKPLAQWLKD